MAKKKAKKPEKKRAVSATWGIIEPEEAPEGAAERLADLHWVVQTATLGTGTGTVQIDKTWFIAKSFMLKQQALLGQLQTDFGFWLRQFVDEAKKK